MTPNDFIAKIKPFAMDEQARSGILCSITIAQAALESGWGSAAPNNNLFGIKAFANERSCMQETKEFVNGQWVSIHARFRAYDNWGESIEDHSKFLIENSRYRRAGFFDCAKHLDYMGCASALQAAGYATDPNYAKLLGNIIVAHDLHEIDEEVQNMLDELKEKIEKLEKIVDDLSDNASMSSIPDWAKDSVDAAVKAGLVKEPKGGSYDFYRLVTILHRKGVI